MSPVWELNSGSPHGYINGRDLSVPESSASGDPTSHVTEHALEWGYRNMSERRVERCACGGDIEATGDWRAIADAIDTHNASTIHEQWRTWREYAA